MALRVLILFAHPALEQSRVHRRLRERVHSLGGITFHDLYEAYPEDYIDVPREQELLRTHDLIVLQHPFYWYSTPAILKEWQDLVLEYGFAYGDGGVALHGKQMLSAITTGGPEDSYGRGSLNRYTVREFLAPLEQTAVLCGMEYLPPFVIAGTHALSSEQIAAHAEDYLRTITALRDGALDLARARQFDHLNRDLASLLPAPAARA